MLSTAKILSYLSTEVSLEIKKLERALKLTKKIERNKLDIAIKALEKLDILERDITDNLKINPQSNFIRARIRCSSKGFCFAVREDGLEDIYIREHQSNHAWHDDLVLVKLNKEAQRRRSPEGNVLCVLERNTTNLIAIVKEKEGKLVADPLDDRFIDDIQLDNKDKIFLKDNELENIVEVRVNKYPIAQHLPQGEVVRELPLDNGIKGDIDILLTKSHLQFNPKAPNFTLKNILDTNRLDCTHQSSLIYNSWSQNNAPQLPAIFVEHIDIGTRIWIHSQAIAERFNFGSKIHDWIKNRGKALCFGNSWRDCISEQLTSASSFTPNVINEAVSLSIDLNNEGEIKDFRFNLTRIKPAAIVNQKQLESIANRKPKARTIPAILKPIKEHINQIQTLDFLEK